MMNRDTQQVINVGSGSQLSISTKPAFGGADGFGQNGRIFMKISAFVLVFFSFFGMNAAYAGGCDETMPCDPLPEGQVAEAINPSLSPIIIESNVYLTTTVKVDVTTVMTVHAMSNDDAAMGEIAKSPATFLAKVAKLVRLTIFHDAISKSAKIALAETAVIDLMIAKPSIIKSLWGFPAALMIYFKDRRSGLPGSKDKAKAILKQLAIMVIVFVILFFVNLAIIAPALLNLFF